MLWKELHVGRRSGLARWVARGAALLGLAAVGHWVGWLGLPAARELLANGYGTHQPAREDFNEFVRIVGMLLYILWMLALAAAAAASISSEREEDTWVSLLTTQLEPAEIILAKMAGAVWGLRTLGLVLWLLWTIGLVLGSVHPLGYLAVIVAWAVYSAFAAALGTLLSLVARTTTRATAAAVAILVFLNGGYLLCCLPVQISSPLFAVGCTPFFIAVLPISYDDFWRLLTSQTYPAYIEREGAIACVISVVGYGVAALSLISVAVADFDAAVDRPHRDPKPLID
jgi:ABC-type transport system involved in multi-copper enzyme maturation permease subunit